MANEQSEVDQLSEEQLRLQKEYAREILLRLYAELGHTARLAVGREIHRLDVKERYG